MGSDPKKNKIHFNKYLLSTYDTLSVLKNTCMSKN